jgi:hypothetical protein
VRNKASTTKTAKAGTRIRSTSTRNASATANRI